VYGKKKQVKRKRSKALPLYGLESCNLNHRPCSSKRKQCPDCHYCQDCSQDRCRLCKKPKKPAPQKLSVAEQIALFERINRKKRIKKK
jgi:hypothetical protein